MIKIRKTLKGYHAFIIDKEALPDVIGKGF
jgi:hypothetical protein